MTVIIVILGVLGYLFVIFRPFLIELIIKKAQKDEIFNNPYELLPYIYLLLLEKYGFVMDWQLAIDFQKPVKLTRQRLDFLVANGYLAVSGNPQIPLYSIPDCSEKKQYSPAMAIATT